jgi:DNA gyrase subunit B
LKDETGLEDYLIELGAGDVTVRGQGAPALSGTPLKQLVKKAIRLDKILDVLERKGRNRHLVVALARQLRFDAAALADEAALREAVAEAERYIGAAAPDLLPVSFPFEDDREHACLRLVASTRTNGTSRRNVFDRELLASAEFEEAHRLARELANAGEPPYTLGEGEGAQVVPNLQHALGRIMTEARKGLDIQRYKGLGEMNPTQLWETTMDPSLRTLLQVKIEDAYQADEVFSTLMGDEVEPRRKFIEANALNVRNLDV